MTAPTKPADRDSYGWLTPLLIDDFPCPGCQRRVTWECWPSPSTGSRYRIRCDCPGATR